MNMFILDLDPAIIATSHCDKHVPKMVVETLQMCGSALIRHGFKDLPLTKSGKPLRGGYHNHPVTRWIGDTRSNFKFAINVGIELCKEYTFRYGKQHFSETGLYVMSNLYNIIPDGPITPFAQAMPDIYKNEDAVKAYRDYYFYDKRTKIRFEWNKCRRPPQWLIEMENNQNALQNGH